MTAANDDIQDHYGHTSIPESPEVAEQDLIDACVGFTYLPIGTEEWAYCEKTLRGYGVNLRDMYTVDALCTVALASRLHVKAPASALALLTGAAV